MYFAKVQRSSSLAIITCSKESGDEGTSTCMTELFVNYTPAEIKGFSNVESELLCLRCCVCMYV